MSQTKAQLISDLVQALNFTGTSSAPANGAFLSAANTLALATNSGQRLTIDSTGKVGIGTTSPSDLLSIKAPANSLAFGAKDTTRDNHVWQLLNNDNEGNAELRLYKNSVSGTHTQSINFATSGDNNYLLDGNFGLGTTNPSFKLQIQGTDNASSGLYLYNGTGAEGIKLVPESNGNCRIYSSTSDILAIGTDSTDRIKIANNSAATSIGGSMAFNAMLTVQGDLSGAMLQLKAAENTNRLMISGTDTAGVEVNFYNAAGGQRGIIGCADEDFFIKAPNSAATMSFHIHDTSSIVELIKIRNDKRVLFGQTTNADIGGSAAGCSINQNATGQLYVCVDDNRGHYYRNWCANFSRRDNAGDGPQLALDRAGWVKASIAGLQGSNTASSAMGQFAIYLHDYGSGFSQYEKFRINAAGSVGIGTSSPTERLHCTGNIRISAADNNWQGNSAGNDLAISGTGDRGISIISGSSSSANVYFGDSDDTDIGRVAYQQTDNVLQIYTNTSKRVEIANDGHVEITDGNLKIGTAGHGIDFSATSGTGTSELLDDYEEGTFTPAYKAVNANPTVGYLNQDGKYTKIGNVVYFQIYLRINSWSGGSGALYIDGMPFTAISSTYGGSGGILYVNSWGGDEPTNFMVGSSSTVLYLYGGGLNGGTSDNLGSADVGTSSQLRINGSYMVA